jgi:short-subunit dehydrogenase
MGKLNFKQRWVLVTGASSGLGKQLAHFLAGNENANLIIASRRKEKLDDLKREIEKKYQNRVEVIKTDLNRTNDIEDLFNRSTAVGPVYALINNAGVTSYGKTDIGLIKTYEQIVDVNFKAAMTLSLLFLPYFREKGEGGILNISSQGAYFPIPYQNVYGAVKSALQNFTEALREENKKTGIYICSVALGGMNTEMFTGSGLDQIVEADNVFMMDPRIAARKVIRSFKRGKRASSPGFLNKLIHFFVRILPRRAVIKIASYIYKPSSKN